VYVKIETNHGISGWGDLKGVDPRPAQVLAQSLFELLDGENPTRIEEPGVPDNIEVFKRLKEQISIPLATGERDRTIWGVLPYLHERCIDILQPDCCHTGGISQMKKIAVLAEAYFVPLAPHCTATFLGIAASLHVVSSIPFFLIHEFYPQNAGFNVPGVTRMEFQLDAEGYIGLPPRSRLGRTSRRRAARSRIPQAANLPLARSETEGWLGGGLLIGIRQDKLNQRGERSCRTRHYETARRRSRAIKH
jgi:L-alanine-DL-glutamate epimerase-like enolase superfamily enzyme